MPPGGYKGEYEGEYFEQIRAARQQQISSMHSHYESAFRKNFHIDIVPDMPQGVFIFMMLLFFFSLACVADIKNRKCKLIALIFVALLAALILFWLTWSLTHELILAILAGLFMVIILFSDSYFKYKNHLD